jgi:hypothetical protein
MIRKSGCLLVVLSLCVATGAFGQVTIPSTPAGQTLRAWLDAINSTDRARIETYVKTIDHDQSVDGMLGFHNETGGFDLLSIESSEPMHIRFRVKEKAGTTTALGNLLVKDGQPPIVATFGLRALPPGVKIENVTIDAAERKKVIDAIAVELNKAYVEPTVAQQMVAAIQAHAAHGDYDTITDGDALADKLTEDLEAVSHDKHLHVTFAPFKMPPMHEPTPEDQARFHEEMEHDNCAFSKVEILPNNIGYVKFDGFMDAGFCGTTVAAAMAFVAHTDAVIFDMRQNGGGQPLMVALVASYLFDKPTHLIDIYNREENSTTQNWTQSYLPGPRLAKQPVYVLTSSHTFSGAEEFAFDLQTQKRATIVGETTGGGAHPVSGHSIADYFMIGVPFAKSLDPVTKKNWEGTGVVPDVKVAADDALTTAQKLAEEKLHEKAEAKAPAPPKP